MASIEPVEEQMTVTETSPVEESAKALRQWLVEERNLPGAPSGLVGPIANFIGDAEVIYRDAVISLRDEDPFGGRVVVFTDMLVIDATITPQSADFHGNRTGTVAITASPRTDLQRITTSDTQVIDLDPFGTRPPQWPWPITGQLHYTNGTTIPMPLDGRQYSSTWASDLLPHLLRDLAAASRDHVGASA